VTPHDPADHGDADDGDAHHGDAHHAAADPAPPAAAPHGHHHDDGPGTGDLAAKVLTVSDGVVAGTREDRSGAALEARLTAEGWRVVDRRVVADGVDAVAGALAELCAGFAGLVVTTGGTGFGPRDLTPEGTRRVLEREAPGLAEGSRLVDPRGRLSRGVAGTIGETVVLNLPGSPGGAVDGLVAVLDVLPHAVRLVAGRPTSH
jgi:molybdenum cofactor synthesis domain-containing protein